MGETAPARSKATRQSRRAGLDREDDSESSNIDEHGGGSGETGLASKRGGEGAAILSTIREVLTTEMQTFRGDITKQLSDFQNNFQADIKKQLDEMKTDINQKMEETTRKVNSTTARLEEAEQRVGEMETQNTAVQDTVTILLRTQHALQAKVTELEGHSRRSNIRLYGIRETAEGTSMIRFVENLIKTELKEDIGPETDLGIERAHRAWGSRPPENAAPRSIIIKFLKFTIKEKVLHAAWKKPITFEGKRVFLDHDYATEVLAKRKEYIPIKKVLKDKGIRFQTPLTRMRVFLKEGAVTYQSAEQAAEDLHSKGFPVPYTRRTKETTAHLPTWETVRGPQQRRDKTGHQQSIRERLKEFQRHGGESTVAGGN